MKPVFDPTLYLVTDPDLSLGRSEAEVVRQAVTAGVTMVQYRDKAADAAQMIETTRTLSGLCRPAGVPLIVNDRLDVALAGGADGIHLGQDDLSCRDARARAGSDFIIGVSVTRAQEARQAEADGADYVAANGVFPTGTKTDLGPPLGLDGLARLVESTRLPVVAIGGIDGSNAGRVLAAGGAGVAVVSFIVAADDIAARCRALLAALSRPPT